MAYGTRRAQGRPDHSVYPITVSMARVTPRAIPIMVSPEGKRAATWRSGSRGDGQEQPRPPCPADVPHTHSARGPQRTT